ncbi:hypothetical protein CRE_20078 [Caenorhabditis remanei]|uniref:Uncharacterized protein n=1 Tax=Caenorhabditis remanei TaxID=31234 RepID=E3NJS7_CAERE|nr:hypothetical protein CRE_20078 [Caenorhabditis remanei]
MVNCSRSQPPDVSANSSVLSIVFIYLALFMFAFIGNVTMFLILCRRELPFNSMSNTTDGHDSAEAVWRGAAFSKRRRSS